MAIAAKTRTPSGKPAKSVKTAAPKASKAKAPTTDDATFENDAFAAIQKPERSSPPLAEVDGEVLEFIAAIDRFKLENGRPFPNWSEILLIVRQLGYKRG